MIRTKETTGCKFCGDLLQWRDRARRIEANSPDMRHGFGALLLIRAWNVIAGEQHAGEMANRPVPEGYKLNYCPVCGRRIDNGGNDKGEDIPAAGTIEPTQEERPGAGEGVRG